MTSEDQRFNMLNFIQKGFGRVKGALNKTRTALNQKIEALFTNKFSEESLDQLEQILYEADLGVKISTDLTEQVRLYAEKNPKIDRAQLLNLLQNELLQLCKTTNTSQTALEEGHPTVMLIVGVNGNGKTTTVAKLARFYQNQGKSVLVAAADTFRAAAIDQLEIWAQKLNIEIVKSKPKSDPSAVAYDAILAALSRKIDVVIIDTAGRLHTKTDLMQELQKIRRASTKALPGCPHATFLVLDATTGHNAIDQAKIFQKYTPLTGVILTKLDGTAKGGVAVAIQKELGIPVSFVGTGENIDDLELFDSQTFVNSMLFNP